MRSGYFLTRLLATLAAMALPMAVLHAYVLYRDYQGARAQSFRAVEAESHQSAREVDAVFVRAENLLTFLASREEMQDLDPARCYELVHRLSLLDPYFNNLGAANLQGQPQCLSVATPATQPSYARAPWFAAGLAAPGFRLGAPVTSRVTGGPVVVLTLPLRDRAGRKVGLLGVSIDLFKVSELISTEGMPPGSTKALISVDATMLARHPEPGAWIGKPISARAQALRKSQPEGTIVARGADGTERVFASVRLQRHGLRLTAGVPTDTAFARVESDIRQALLVAAAVLALALGLAFFGARRLAGPLHSLSRTIERQAAGEREERADEALPGEFGALAAGFNRMLEAQQAGEARLRQSERHARRLADFYEALSGTNQAIVRLREPDALFDAICRICVECGHATMAWIGLLRHNEVVPVAWGGAAAQYTRGLTIRLDPHASDAVGPTARSVHEGHSIFINDFMHDPGTLPWRERAAPFDVRSSAALPFRRAGRIVGVLNVYVDEAGFFDEQLVQLLDRMVMDLSFALDMQELEAARLEAEQALARRELQLAGIVDTALEAIITVDATQTVRVFNRAAAEMFGLPAEEAIGRHLDHFLPERLRAAHRQHVQRYAEGVQEPRQMGRRRALVGLRARGEEFPIEASISRAGEGCDLLLTVMIRDTTEQHEAERARLAAAAADAANQAKTEFLSRMSHELRTPLNAMLGFTQLLQIGAGPRLAPTEREQLDLIFTAGAQLQALIDDMLDVARIESGQLPLVPSELDLDSLLNEVVSLSRSAADAAGVALAPPAAGGSVPGSGVRLHTDPIRLRQVLLNLVSNGIKYNRRGGSVQLQVTPTADTVQIRVQDDGLGMTPDQLAGLFQPFNRLGREHTAIAGTGLGLALTRQLVELMGGHLDVRSEAERGTTVTLTLPRGMAGTTAAQPAPRGTQAASGEHTPDAATDGPGGTVLYIEDNPVNVVLVQQMLRIWPALRLEVATDGKSGLEAVRRLQPDLLLLDMQLPDLTGLQVLERLRADPRTAGLRVVALSASAMPDQVAAARAAGVLDYWTKPIDIHAFHAGMRALLEPAA